MRGWKWIALAIATMMAIVMRWHWQTNILPTPAIQSLMEHHPPTLPQVLPERLSAAEPARFTIPDVDAEQLMAHVSALAFTRYEERDRTQAKDYLVQAFENLGWTPRLQLFESGTNVIAERVGTDPEAGKILIAAHYDTVQQSPGADDNASGVAVALEVARLLTSVSTPRTLQIAFFDLEESGLLGSQAFTAQADHLTDLHGAIIMDMVGHACYVPGCQQYPEAVPKILQRRDQGDFLAIIGGMEHTTLLRAFQPRPDGLPLEKLSVPLRGILTPDLLRSDHAPFWHQGIPAVLLTDTANFRNPNYHQSTDQIDAIDLPFLTGAAQAVLDATVTLLTESA